jgi:thiamine pyrophosphate-dependent acetolactate synthase large subunit-like protein
VTEKEALEVVAHNRGEKVVITTMSATGLWPEISDAPLDFHYLPSTMGQGPSLALGLAMSGSSQGVIVINGDGCTLMNLGCLVTIARHPADLWTIVMDNGIYQVTGGQPTAGQDLVDFAAVARGCGVRRVYEFEDAAAWKSAAPEVLSGKGPVLVRLAVDARYGLKGPSAPRPMKAQLARLRGALGLPEAL